MKIVMILVCIVGVLGFVVVEPTWADPVSRYLCTSGDWSVGTNWNTNTDCTSGSTGVPDIDDDVIIKSGKTVDVDVDSVCRSIDVQSTAVMNIEANSYLTVNTVTSPGPTTSYINGTVYLQGGDARLRFEDNDHTLTGSGEIVGQDNTAVFDIRTIDFVNEVDMRGKMEVHYYGPHGQAYSFQNKATFHADTNGTFLITLSLIDTGDALYKVSTSASAILKPGSQTDLNGDFDVFAGQLECLGDLNTFGTLTQTGGTIHLLRGVTVIFSDTP